MACGDDRRDDLAGVEAALLSHSGVGAAAVTVDADGRLTATVVPAPDPDDDADDDEDDDGVAGWADVFDDLYADPDAAPFRGWTDRVGGRPIPVEHMEAWRRAIVERVRALGGRRLLEVGAGEGLLVPGLAADVDDYWATDVSAAALALLESRSGERLDGRLTLRRCAAHETAGLPAGHFDVVVVNSVVQYFPDAAYLATVLHRLAELLAPGGVIVVGDVRALELGRLHHDALTVARTGAADPAAADRSLAAESELLVAPAFFDDVVAADPVLARAEPALPEHTGTEMSRYRYDVLLHTTPGAAVPAPELRWGHDVGDVGAWAAALDGDERAAVVLTGVPDARLAADLAATARLRAARGDPVAAPAHAPDHADLVAAARSRGHVARAVRSAGDPYAVDVVAHRAGTPPPARLRTTPGERTNRPAAAVATPEAAAFADGLRAYVATRLPAAWVPGTITVVDRLP